MSHSGRSGPPRAARESAGMPCRYLLLSRPCASGENATTAMPADAATSSSDRPTVGPGRSTQRLSNEYAGWCTASGRPMDRATASAATVRSAEYDEIPA